MPQIRSRDVVVVTGASSGIGKSTAVEFAKRGVRLVLAARNLEKLESVAAECRELGAECLVCKTDVTNEADVRNLADLAVKAWGRIDVWINNAGIGAVGPFTEIPVDEHRRVLETNVLGYIYGAHAAMKVFEIQKTGVLINNASVCSRLVMPSLSSYTASKFAVRGLTHSLRQDLAVAGLHDIHVCQLNPAVIDTPAFEHASNYSGRPIEMKMPKSTPEEVARAMVGLVENPKREAYVGPLAKTGSWAYTFFPALTGFVLVWGMKRYYASALQASDAAQNPT